MKLQTQAPPHQNDADYDIFVSYGNILLYFSMYQCDAENNE
jgi:hypothetical protein